MIEITINTEDNLDYYNKYHQTKEIPLFINGLQIGTYKLFETINNFKVIELMINNKKWYIYSGYGLITSNLNNAPLLNFTIDNINNTITIYLNEEEYNEIANS